MFGHLKAEDFMNLMEGSPLPDRRRVHLESCARCAETLKSVEAIRSQVAVMHGTADEYIPEPDWSEFRGEVRNALLSRSVKRESANRSLLAGMGWKPAAAWGLSVLLVFGLTTSVVLWNQDNVSEPAIARVTPIQDSSESAAMINAISGMGQTDVFDDLIQLNERETENLKLLLEDLARKNVTPR